MSQANFNKLHSHQLLNWNSNINKEFSNAYHTSENKRENVGHLRVTQRKWLWLYINDKFYVDTYTFICVEK